MNLALSMAAFALASSVTPGPVDLVALGVGACHGWRASLPYVFGATAGFTALLVLLGLGVQQAAHALPALTQGLRRAGIAFLLFMAWKLRTDDGEPAGPQTAPRRPTALAGAAMQWLNPKAWRASVSGMAVHVAGGDTRGAWQFAAIYLATRRCGPRGCRRASRPGSSGRRRPARRPRCPARAGRCCARR